MKMDAVELLHYVRSWTPGPDYPDAHDGPFKQVFKFDNDALEAIKIYSSKIRDECTIESKHMYQVGFDHGQQNVKDALRDLITPLLDSVNGDCCRGEEWEMEQVSIIRRIIK